METPSPAARVVTRFAPSPTGYLHIGGARTALFNWAFARQQKGTFILRMEDTDQARSTQESVDRILNDLKWLGLNWDEGPQVGGNRGPYFQSQRQGLYEEYLEKLRKAGRVYEDKGALRFRMPGHDITVNDMVLGPVTIKTDKLEDFIIMKSAVNGVVGPTFHFANVVDDATMGVTHVLRAQEHLMNTPKHLALFEALEIEPPRYAHMPLIFNPDGSKMSKRDKAKTVRAAVSAKSIQWGDLTGLSSAITQEQWENFINKKSDDVTVVQAIAQAMSLPLPEIDVHDFRVSGYLQQVLLNYLSLLGWNPGGNIAERFDLPWLIENFTIEGIGKSNAKFDRNKLLAFNAQELQQMPLPDFACKLAEHLKTFHPEFGTIIDSPHWLTFAQAYQPRCKTLSDPAIMGRFFVTRDEAIEFDGKAVEKVLRKNDCAGLKILEQAITAIQNWQQPTDTAQNQGAHGVLDELAKKLSVGMGDVAQPVRVAITGGTVSPPMDLTLAILGKERVLNRMKRCLAVVEGK